MNQRVDSNKLTYAMLSPEQKQFVDLGMAGHNVNLVGEAGSGKTAALRVLLQLKLERGDFTKPAYTTKVFGEQNHFNMAAVTFTRRSNVPLRKAMPTELARNVWTCHNLVEYQPVQDQKQTADGFATVMRFKPARNEDNPLPHLNLLVLDEAGQTGITLWKTVLAALFDYNKTQRIFLGDLEQLPPVQDHPVLGYSLVKNKTVVLTRTYRQSGDSPILKFARLILDSHQFTDSEIDTEWKAHKPTVNIVRAKPTDSAVSVALALFGSENSQPSLMQTLLANGTYNPNLDIIITGFNEQALGVKPINSYIATIIDSTLPADYPYPIVPVKVGSKKFPYRVGDKVLYNAEDYYITAIEDNPLYISKGGLEQVTNIDRFGREVSGATTIATAAGILKHTSVDLDEDALDSIAQRHAEEDSRDALSHVLTLTAFEDGKPTAKTVVSTKGELAKVQLGYCITAHKSQGSQWRNVFVVCHHSQAALLTKEWLYTACTRPTEKLWVMGTLRGINQAIARRQIKGETLEDKIAAFAEKENCDSVEV